MARGREFSAVEVDLLIENYETMTIIELEQILLKEGYRRSRKSINRKLEKLREDGVIGHRNKKTIERAYKQRGKNKKKNVPSKLEDVPPFGFGFEDKEGFGSTDWGDSDWGDSDWGEDE